jgi:hypothetical protein
LCLSPRGCSIRRLYLNAQTNANAIASATANIHRQSFANAFSNGFCFFIADDNTDSDADNERHRSVPLLRVARRESGLTV